MQNGRYRVPFYTFSQEIIAFTKNLFLEVMNEMFADIFKEAFDKVFIFVSLTVGYEPLFYGVPIYFVYSLLFQSDS